MPHRGNLENAYLHFTRKFVTSFFFIRVSIRDGFHEILRTFPWLFLFLSEDNSLWIEEEERRTNSR